MIKVSPERASTVGPGNRPSSISSGQIDDGDTSQFLQLTVDEIDPLQYPIWSAKPRGHTPIQILSRRWPVHMILRVKLYPRSSSDGLMFLNVLMMPPR